MTEILSVTPKDLSKWLAAGEAVVVDVREVLEYKQHHIKNAVNLPLSDVCLDHQHMPKHDGKRLVFHCKSGKRSMMACEKIKGEDVELTVWNLTGGIDGWMAEGLAVKESGADVMPLERQVLLAAGSIVLIGTILGFTVGPSWFLLSGFAGLGMTFAGLTGWCGMAMLLAKMPWNR